MPTTTSHQEVLHKALADYTKQTDVELEKHPFANELQGRYSPDDVFTLFENKADEFETYQNGDYRLTESLKPVLRAIHGLSGVLGEDVMPFQPSKAVYICTDVLITAADGVNSRYYELVHLFGRVSSALEQVNGSNRWGTGPPRDYADIPSTPSVTRIIIKIMAELLSIFSIATKQLKQGGFRKKLKELQGGGEIQIGAELKRFEHLTGGAHRIIRETVDRGLVNSPEAVLNDDKSSTDGTQGALDITQDLARQRRDAEIVLRQAKTAKQEAAMVKREAERVKREAETAKREAERVKREAETTKQEVERVKREAVMAKQEAETVKRESETAKQEAETAKREAEVIKREVAVWRVEQETRLKEREARLMAAEHLFKMKEDVQRKEQEALRIEEDARRMMVVMRWREERPLENEEGCRAAEDWTGTKDTVVSAWEKNRDEFNGNGTGAGTSPSTSANTDPEISTRITVQIPHYVEGGHHWSEARAMPDVGTMAITGEEQEEPGSVSHMVTSERGAPTEVSAEYTVRSTHSYKEQLHRNPAYFRHVARHS